ncbi:MAG: DUF1830 domain-containing protein [Cyanobacteria bacterium P01_C01_bin.118]
MIQKKQFKSTVFQISCQDKKQHSQQNRRIQCCYVNNTPQFQIVRVVNFTRDFLERAVMPYAMVTFEAYWHDHLEIHTGSPISTILSDKIPCHRLAYAGDYEQ